MHILNVGDAASSFYVEDLSGDDDLDVLIADCGSGRKGTAAGAAEMLAGALNMDMCEVRNVVITHFDADHWKGLLELPDAWWVPPKEVTLRYPYLLPHDPGLIQVAHLALHRARGHEPVTAALDIIDRWEKAGVHVTPCPMKRGDVFAAAGKSWTVHWPPRDFSAFAPQTQRLMRDIAGEIRRAAEKTPVFREAIQRVQQEWFAQGDGHDGADRLTGEPLTAQRPSDMPATVEAPAVPTAKDVIDALRKDMRQEQLNDFRGRVKKYNNALSVVFTTDTVANFGDCEGAGLTALLQSQRGHGPRLAVAYDVILSPHHGTQIPVPSTLDLFPFASRALVCQNGHDHHITGLDDDIQSFRERTTRPWSADVDNTYLRGRLVYGDL